MLFFCVKKGYAYDQPLKYLGIEQGLSNNAVTTIYKDHYGFMWIGTYDGLNRYDGSTVKTFRNIYGDNQSLNDNHVNRIAGLGNKIFVGTLKGLVYYNYNDSHFYPLLYSAKNGPQNITNNVTGLQTDSRSNIYIGTDYAGFFTYHEGDEKCKQITFGNLKTKYSVQAVTCDAQKQVWVFVRDAGLCLLDEKHNKLQLINAELKSANCLLTDAYAHIWVGTDNGLFIYDLRTHHMVRLPDSYGRLTSDNIMDIRFAKNSELWVGTNGGGINVIDTANHKTTHMVSSNENSASLRSNAISMIYEDNEARVWIATLRGGVNILDNRRNQFKLITHDPFNKNSVVNNFIISFCEDELHNLWIGTDGGGLSYWNRKANVYTNYVHTADKGSVSSNFVVSMIKDHKNLIWVATFSGGIDRFDKSSGKFIHYSCYNPNTKTEDKSLWKLYLDSHNNLWAGVTRGGALYWYNRKADKFEIFDDQLTNIHAIFEDDNGTLWLGDYSQLIKVDVSRKNHQYISIKNAVRSITEDGNRNLWIGTEGGGLLKYNIPENKLTRFTQADGLPSNSLLNVLVDNSGNLWGSTYNGLTEYNITTKKFKNFYASDGLQSNQFNFNAALKLSTGELAFGGIDGFNLFYPDSIKLPVREPELRLTGLHIDNKAIDGNTSYTGRQAVVDLKTITIPYNEATIAIDYTTLEYSFPDKINYAYYLESWDHGWNYVGQLKTAYYTRLNEGTYTLRIKATNTAGAWNNHQLVLHIIVLPPWYRTWLAYLCYILVIGFIVYRLWRYQTKQTKLKYEIEITNLKAERDKELNEKKLSFFTNISHEFRTPLTLIINPIKDLLHNSSGGDKNDLNTIYRNARRLLGLVDHLLLFRKAESESDSLKVVRLNFTILCQDVYQCFVHQAKAKNITYNFNHGADDVELYADREKIEIVLFNLISNAIKFTPDNGKIEVNLKQNDDLVLLEVSDNGRGIDAGIGEKLFDKYYQIKDKNSLKTGFGIGLYLVKTFIAQHHGSINYHNNPTGGTSFTLQLKTGKLHFSSADILDDAVVDQSHHQLLDPEMEEEGQTQPEEESVNQLELLISDRQSVLIIDDNEQLRDYVAKIFKRDYKIYEAVNGEQGLEYIKKFLPDIIISDIKMDDLDGIELCKIIKQDSLLSHIPVILMTGDSTPELQLKGIEVGAVDFISKPFEKDLLIARVNGILRSKTELQNYFYNEVTLKSSARRISEEHKDFLYKCVAIIESNIIDNDFDVQAIADEMGMSYSSLFKKIKLITGQSVNNFIRFIRIRKAAELLINTNCNVNEAAMNVGVNDIKYFREHFVKVFGMKPSEFLKKHRTAFHKNYRVEEAMKFPHHVD
ncbi:two-component regulator propeller domain-containing protein [Mucilaginibacter sp. AW1-3]